MNLVKQRDRVSAIYILMVLMLLPAQFLIYLERKKKLLNLKVRDGQYLTNEEQYLLAQIDLFIEELYEEFNSTASTKGPKI